MPSKGGSTQTASWARVWMARDRGFEALLSEVCGYDPLRIQQTRDACTWEEVARAYKHLKAKQEGFGWRTT